MKTDTLKRIKLRHMVGAAFVFAFVNANAQLYNSGNLYVGDGVKIHLSSGKYYLTSGTGTNVTSRTTGTHGTISLGSDASWESGPSFINGHLVKQGTGKLLLPVGETAYAPAMVEAATTVTANAIYHNAAPASGTLDSALSALATSGYWGITAGSNVKLSLGWNASLPLPFLSPNLQELTIAAYNGSSWVMLPSTVSTEVFGEASTANKGSITTDAALDLNAYSAFTFAMKGGCFVAPSSGNTITWNGSSWSPSVPTIHDAVVIAANYNNGSFECNALVMNADITLSDGQSVTIANGATGNGLIKMSAQASVVQQNGAATAPKIEITKVTKPMRRFDYIFASSPINSGTGFIADLNNPAKAIVYPSLGNGQYNTAPTPQALNAFSSYKVTNSAGALVSETVSAPIGKGLALTVRNQAPYATAGGTSWDTEKYPVQIKTTGTANNGDVSVTIPANTWAMIGNPYPSAVDGEKLLATGGANIRKTLYYWTYNTPMTAAFKYSSTDYATWTHLGGTAACQGCDVPNGKLATMQGVYVKAEAAGAATLTFDNCMRTTGSNNQFFRPADDVRDRYWLNLTGSQGSFSQILVVYSEYGSEGVDEGDGPRLANNIKSSMSSLIGTTRYAIQSKPEFDEDDAVPLSVERIEGDNLTISLDKKEGIFATEDVTIYLHDKQLNTYQDLSAGDYSFSIPTGMDHERFEVVYVNSALDVDDHELNSKNVMAFIDNSMFNAQASSNMAHVEIYDMAGRKVAVYAPKAQKMAEPFHHADGIYIAKIRMEDGSWVSKKVIHLIRK